MAIGDAIIVIVVTSVLPCTTCKALLFVLSFKDDYSEHNMKQQDVPAKGFRRRKYPFLPGKQERLGGVDKIRA